MLTFKFIIEQLMLFGSENRAQTKLETLRYLTQLFCYLHSSIQDKRFCFVKTKQTEHTYNG
jgi:hypothetical protein